MAQQSPLAPGHALNDYLRAVDLALDSYVHGKVSWSELQDLREQAAARLNGRLVDHFLVRAHGRRELATSNPAATSPDGS